MKVQELKTYINKVLVFYSPSRAGYWNSITRCTVIGRPSELGRYYLDFSSKISYPGEFSEDGIPLLDFRGREAIEMPTVVAQFALGIFELLYQKKYNDDALKHQFIKQAEWFDRNKTEFKNGQGWYLNVSYPQHGVNSPFLSAMAQGEAISVLTRAYMLTGNQQFEQLAIEALSPFEYNVEDGGVVDYFNSIPIYEEGPTPIGVTGALNGFIFSLFGLYDLYLLNKNDKALKLFLKGIDSLIKLLPFFDIKHWTRYYLFNYPKKYYSSYTYHILVAEQLKAIYHITGENIFLEYSDRWFDYSKSFINRTRALLKKLTDSNQLVP